MSTDLALVLLTGLVASGAMLAAMPWLGRSNPLVRPVLIAVALALTGRYVAWRWFETLPPSSSPADLIAAVMFASTETLTIIGTCLTLLTMSRTRDRTGEADANAGWLSGQQPLVDVFICTFNEERAILERTIVGALAMDYSKFRVWVLDDGRRPWLEALCASKGCHYLTRSDNTHAKAGNINNALDHVASLATLPDFVCILDADFVPLPNLLSRALCLFRDPGVGIVQPPQHFVNPDPIQSNLTGAHVWPDEQRYFFDVMLPSKDAWDAAFCCGSPAVIRFSALRQIGAIPTDSVTEDVLLSLRMVQAGYRTVYLNEMLAVGLAPEGLKEYATQRGRWCLGMMQIFRGPLSPLRPSNGVPLRYRLAMIEAFLYWSATYTFRVLCLAAPIAYWLFGLCVVQADVASAVSYFLPYFLGQLALTGWLGQGRILPILTDVGQLLIAPEILRAVVVGLIKPKGHKFRVTAKGGDRGHRYVQWIFVRRFAVLLALTVAGIAMAFAVDGPQTSDSSCGLCLFWSWYNIAVLVVACAVCVEQPRFRKDERRASREPATLLVGASAYDRRLLDFSAGGLRLAGAAPASVGTPVTVALRSHRLPATIVRRGPDDFAVRLEGEAAREAMIRDFYSTRYSPLVSEIRSWRVATTIMRRLWQ